MDKDQIGKKYDLFFGNGLLERAYKPHIVIFAEQCSVESGFVKCSEELPEIGQPCIVKMRGGKIAYAIYSDYDEFDVHLPDEKGFEPIPYRKKWYKFSCATVKKWKPLK